MNNEQNNNVIPQTPNTPVLPQDQAMNVTASIPTQVEPVPVTPTISEAPVQQIPTPQPVPQPVSPTPVAPPPQTNPVVPPVNSIPEGIHNGTLVNGIDASVGVKEGNQALPQQPKKKTSKFLLILILVLIIIGGAGYAVIYFTQYKNVDKRVNQVIDGLFSSLLSINNDNFEKKSGTYTLESTIDFDDKNYTIELEGSYAYDLTQSLDLTFNFKSLDLDEEILTTGPLATEIYLYDGNAYFLLQNFYDNYIFTEFPYYKSLSDYINQNNIDYVQTKTILINAFKSGVDAMGNQVSLENINGFKNVITIPVNTNTVKNFLTAFFNVVKESDDLETQITKIVGVSKNEFEKNIDKYINNYSMDESGTIRIVTGLFDKTLEEITLNMNNSNITINPINNGYHIKSVSNGQTVMDLDYTKTTKKTTSTDEKEIKLKGIITITFADKLPDNLDIKEDTVYTIDITYNNVANVTPNVEKINLRDAVRIDNISPEDMISIIEKVKQFGKLSDYLKERGINLDNLLPEQPAVPEGVEGENVVSEGQEQLTEQPAA